MSYCANCRQYVSTYTMEVEKWYSLLPHSNNWHCVKHEVCRCARCDNEIFDAEVQNASYLKIQQALAKQG